MKKKEQLLFDAPASVKTHIQALLQYMTEGIYEKQHIMSMALLAAIAGESVFLLGPPGTAKSMVARRLKMVFANAKAFEYLMSRFSTPEEIFGPVSISKLKNEDKYERLVTGYLPDSEVVFLDEIWKAGPSIQNALLTAINERIFKNGTETLRLPMKALIAASNELPAEDEGLEALWDRFLVRLVSNCISSEATFYKMIREKGNDNPDIPVHLLITDEKYQSWQKAIHSIEIPNEICQIVTQIRKQLTVMLKQEGVEPMDYYISDRRWKKAFHLMQASAFLNGRNVIDITELPILFHCLWNKAETITHVLNIVSSAVTAEIDAAIEDQQKRLDKIVSQASATYPQSKSPTDDNDEFALTNFFYYTIEGFGIRECLFAKTDYSHIDVNRVSDGLFYYWEKTSKGVIHAIYEGGSFNKVENNGKVIRVKLQKCRGGIIIDGTPYSFKKRGVAKQQEKSVQDTRQLDTVYATHLELQNKIQQLQAIFSKCENLFVSNDDSKLVSRQISKSEKALNELYIKMQNTTKFLQ